MTLPLSSDTLALAPTPTEARDPVLPEHGALDADAPESSYRTQRRFDRAARLFTEPGLHALMGARVLVVGCGGVGSFAAEALARSGVGELVLIDFDKVCITNSNRQLHAMKGTIGKPKVDVMAARLRLVHPTAEVVAEPRFYNAESAEQLLAGRVDFVVDCIDNMTAKAHLVATCLERGIPIVSSMGAAARLDPTQIRTGDLCDTEIDPFARAFRKLLRKHHGVDVQRAQPIGVHAVYSVEVPREPAPLAYDEGQGFVCVCPGGKNGLNDCDKKNRIDGSAAFVTGAFGLAAASVVVRVLSGVG
ncbi:MAG: tRNA threonylcarbamoyladenosine dehydratase [Sandaracinaceae bacterium]|nr:tRNA threonylcarbamoyladenosine dehydratase [Sandaracinaceae bacterium]